MGNGNRPTPEFRREAVRLALTSGRTRREIAEDLGIGLSTLTRWLGQERGASDPGEAVVDLHSELKRLRRENAVLKQEREILIRALKESGFNRTATAARLGISLRQIRYRIARLNIAVPNDQDPHDDQG